MFSSIFDRFGRLVVALQVSAELYHAQEKDEHFAGEVESRRLVPVFAFAIPPASPRRRI